MTSLFVSHTANEIGEGARMYRDGECTTYLMETWQLSKESNKEKPTQSCLVVGITKVRAHDTAPMH